MSRGNGELIAQGEELGNRTDFYDGDLLLHKVQIVLHLRQALRGGQEEQGSLIDVEFHYLLGRGEVLLEQLDGLLEGVLHHYVGA